MARSISKKNLLAGLAAAGVLGVGLAAPTIAFADEKAGDTPSASSSSDSSGEQRNDREQRRAEHQTAFAEALAKELGVSADEVTTALEKVREQLKPADRPDGEARPGDRDGKGGWGGKGDRSGDGEQAGKDRQAAFAERLAQAVTDGKLTQEQADAITAAVEAGVLGGGERGHGGPAGTETPEGTETK